MDITPLLLFPAYLHYHKSLPMSNDRTNGVVGFLAGLAAGAALGVLFAPRSGKDTREAIAGAGRKARDRFGDTMDEAHQAWSEMKGKAQDTATMTREDVEDFLRFLFEEGRDLADRLRKDVSATAEEAAAKAQQTADHIRHGH